MIGGNDPDPIAQFVASSIKDAHGLAARRALFVAVRNLPYATDAAADAVALIRMGRGNCLAKAALLARGLRLLGAEARRVRWRYLLPEWPPEVDQLPSRDDIHTAVEVAVAGHYILVDATHDPALARGSFVVSDWDGDHPTAPAYERAGPLWREGLDDAAITAALATIAAPYGGDEAARMASAATAYRHAFNAWLEQLRAEE